MRNLQFRDSIKEMKQCFPSTGKWVGSVEKICNKRKFFLILYHNRVMTIPVALF